jgi:type I restriction enzyme R subunit
MIQHFRGVTLHKIGGRAKAMVVTASRLHAVRYLLEFRRQIKANSYTNLDVLAAFSGEVDDQGKKYTEESLNKTLSGETIKETQLRNYFHTDEFNMLIVAEKYQTGFDEPYLHTMFVDKQLSGVKAVQTLSRLNRTMPGKEDTFILDFVNTADDIKNSFEPYYEAAFLEEETSPNVVYTLKNTLDDYRIYHQAEVEQFANLYFSRQDAKALGKLSGIFKPAIDRYLAKPVEDKDQFSKNLSRFIRIYSFITQVCRLFDKEIHRFSIYAKFLLKFLPTKDVERAEVDDKVIMEYYRLQKSFEGAIPLKGTETGFSPISGHAGAKKKQKDTLQTIIDRVNEKFGTQFTEADKLLRQLVNDFTSKEKYAAYAQNNDEDVFRILFEKDFMNVAATRYEQNEAFFVRMFDDPAFMKFITGLLSSEIYRELRQSYNSEGELAAEKAPPYRGK